MASASPWQSSWLEAVLAIESVVCTTTSAPRAISCATVIGFGLTENADVSQAVSASVIAPTVTLSTYWLPLPPLWTVIATSPVAPPGVGAPVVDAVSVMPVAEPTVAEPLPEPLAVKYAKAVVPIATPTATTARTITRFFVRCFRIASPLVVRCLSALRRRRRRTACPRPRPLECRATAGPCGPTLVLSPSLGPPCRCPRRSESRGPQPGRDHARDRREASNDRRSAHSPLSLFSPDSAVEDAASALTPAREVHQIPAGVNRSRERIRIALGKFVRFPKAFSAVSARARPRPIPDRVA